MEFVRGADLVDVKLLGVHLVLSAALVKSYSMIDAVIYGNIWEEGRFTVQHF